MTTWNNQECMDFRTMFVINSSWCGSYQMNLIRLIFDWTVFGMITSFSSPNSCSNLYFYHVILKSWCCMSCCFWQGNFWQRDFYINAHMRKFWTGPVAIFKLLRVFNWSPSNQKLLTASKVTSKKKSKKV